MDGMSWLVFIWVHVAGMVAILLLSNARALREIFCDPQFADIPKWLRFVMMWAMLYIVSLTWPAFMLYAIITEKK